MLRYPANDSVIRVTGCDLRAGGAAWGYARENAAAIDAHWETATAVNPAYFNGTVHLMDELDVTDRRMSARLLQTDFKSYLHWRTAGFPETGVSDGFGSALLTSGDGAMILGRQRAGNINAGLAYLPGGFIDSRDVGADGRVDIVASVARELAEETGLDVSALERLPGFLVTRSHAQVSIAVHYVAAHDASDLKNAVEHHIARDAHSELAEVVIVRGSADLEGLAMPRYTEVLLRALFAGSEGSA